MNRTELTSDPAATLTFAAAALSAVSWHFSVLVIWVWVKSSLQDWTGVERTVVSLQSAKVNNSLSISIFRLLSSDKKQWWLPNFTLYINTYSMSIYLSHWVNRERLRSCCDRRWAIIPLTCMYSTYDKCPVNVSEHVLTNFSIRLFLPIRLLIIERLFRLW